MDTLQGSHRINEVDHFYKKVIEAHREYFHYWLHHTLFHWDFFLSLFLAVVPWVLWFIFRHKESRDRLLFAGFFVIITTSWLDFWGTMYGLWFYTGKVLPSMPSFIPWDFCLLPVFVMLLIQYKPIRSPYLKGLIFAGGSAFIGELLFQWIGLYVMTNWSIFYSFPIYFVIYLIAHRLSKASHFAEV
ncbi:CBO0543 family protein [Heyndrickxia acidicola]|uniref:DUF2878 domain-containing protein n=1 Tax=Heyndrickxia acidicola TaxID=209389 RepID=A0ABU6MLB4_9BACI|nr:CBO0543 family protein [Heyndrickxia acidicola]MED1205310.1 hypothetical protein [Heyndrickxia acidicola]